MLKQAQGVESYLNKINDFEKIKSKSDFQEKKTRLQKQIRQIFNNRIANYYN